MKDIQEVAPGLENPGQPLKYVATAGQPEEEHLRQLAEAGYRTVIDLRTSEEDPGFDESEMVRQVGMEYVNIPVGHEAIEDETFEWFRELMKNPERRPVLVHCSSANRVGALLVPYLVLDEGRTPEDTEEIASEVGL
ncbi:MAG: protein tyrosine phosphatase family protein, partial [Actinomycetota bacterium]|nr:protein tyrosine phosphatase family protein [Actinomycetota bacterium]